MKRLLVIAMVLWASAAVAQTADDIIARHYDATGGREKWTRVTALRFTGGLVLGPGMLAPVTSIKCNKPTRASYFDFTWMGMTSKNVMLGDSGWTYQPFGGKRETDPMSPDELRSTLLEADPQGLLLNYKANGCSVEYLGTEDVDGSDVYKLRLTSREGDMVYYYFDTETYYLLKTTKRLRLKDKEEKSSMTFSNFRKTDFGITVPFSMQQVDENGIEQGGPVTLTKVDVNPTIDYSIFDRAKK